MQKADSWVFLAIVLEYARDELVNRGLKAFGTKLLPFKHDLDSPEIKITWYAESFRRKVLDIV